MSRIIDGLNLGTIEALAVTLNSGLVAEASLSSRPPSTAASGAADTFVGFAFSFQFFTRPVAIGSLNAVVLLQLFAKP